MNKLVLAIAFILLFDFVSAQISTNGASLTDLSSTPGTCAAGGFQTVNFASTSASCINLTTNGTTFENGAVWACDPIDLNQTFKVSFTANFGSDITTGDGIAFLLQIEGVPNVIGGAGGGIGYGIGTSTNCLPLFSTNCEITPSLAIEFDTYDHSTFSINDLVCDHMSMQVNGDQTLSGTINGPNCLLSGGATIKDGLDHDICIAWDPSSFGSLQVYFDGLLVSTYAGNIRSFFGLSAATVSWGFTSAKGPAPQIHTICNVNMETNIASPSCSCITEDASFSVTDFCSGSANAASGIATSGGTFSFNPAPGDGALINPSTGEVINGIAGTTYTVQYVTSGLCPGTSTQNVTVIALDDPTYVLSDFCEGASNSATGIVTTGGVFSFSPDPGDGSTINASTGEITNGVGGATYTIEYLTNGVCPASLRLNVTVSPSDDPAFTLTDYCEGGTNAAAGIATVGGVFSFDPDLGDGSTVDASTGSITSGIGGTTYTLEYVTAGVCPDSITQTVTTLAIDDPSFSYSSATFCLTGGNQLPTTLATAGGAFTGSAGLSINSSTGEIDVATTGIGSYDVTYTTTGSCPDDLTLTIDITASPDAAFSYASSPYCQSGIATITFGPGASGGVFSEATGDLSINPSTGEVDLSGSVSGIYTVMNDIAASGGCAAANSSASIEVIATDDPAFILTDYCEGSANSATGIATAGGVFSFNPDLGDGATLISSTGEILSGVGSTTYSIQYITAGICFSDTTISVTVYDSVYAGQNSTVSFCESGAIDSLFGYLGTIENSGSWSGPSILSDGFYGAFNPGSNGSGDYMYVVLSSGVCPNDTAIISVDVLNPIADFSASVTSGSAPLNVDFTNTSTDAVSYLWNTDLSTSTDLNVEEVYTTEGEYSVMLVASNGICTDTAFLIVSVFGDSELLVPNIFTPNGDGQNDLFLPISQGIDEYELLIYNRWGQLVVSIEQSNHGWDGRNSAGELVQDGTYYFVISGLGLDKQVFSETGHFLLER